MKCEKFKEYKKKTKNLKIPRLSLFIILHLSSTRSSLSFLSLDVMMLQLPFIVHDFNFVVLCRLVVALSRMIVVAHPFPPHIIYNNNIIASIDVKPKIHEKKYREKGINE